MNEWMNDINELYVMGVPEVSANFGEIGWISLIHTTKITHETH
jgi:hypothetical protein